MWYLTVAVGFVGVLCVADLLLSFGVIRRLREHTAELERLAGVSGSAGAGAPGMTILETGTRVGEFAATTTAGTIARREQPDQPQRLFAFVSPGCHACEDQLPAFIRYAADYPGHAVTAVVHTAIGQSDADTVPYAARLGEVAEVVIEPQDGPVGKAFEVAGYPMWYLVDAEGMVQAGGIAIDRIAVPATR